MQQPKQQICPHYTKGRCFFESTCKFLHVIPNEIPSNNKRTTNITNNTVTNKPCPYFASGTCYYGDRCRFQHTVVGGGGGGLMAPNQLIPSILTQNSNPIGNGNVPAFESLVATAYQLLTQQANHFDMNLGAFNGAAFNGAAFNSTFPVLGGVGVGGVGGGVGSYGSYGPHVAPMIEPRRKFIAKREFSNSNNNYNYNYNNNNINNKIGNAVTKKEFTSPKPCRFWAEGTCNYGDSCKFTHYGGPGSVMPPPEVYQERDRGSKRPLPNDENGQYKKRRFDNVNNNMVPNNNNPVNQLAKLQLPLMQSLLGMMPSVNLSGMR